MHLTPDNPYYPLVRILVIIQLREIRRQAIRDIEGNHRNNKNEKIFRHILKLKKEGKEVILL